MPKNVEVGVILKGKDQASDDVRKVSKSIGGMNKSVGKSIGSMIKWAAVIYGVQKAFRTALDMTQYAANVSQVGMAFQSIAENAGVSADRVLASMEKMSGGTITQLDLMLSANKASLLGLPLDKMDQLMAIARASATATGQSVKQMFDDIVTGIGRASPKILDNLGIMVKMERAYKTYGDLIGKTTKELSEAERAQATMNAVLAQGEVIINRVGEAGRIVTDAERVQRLKKSWMEVKAELGKNLLPVFVDISEKLVSIFNDAIPYIKRLPEVLIAVGDIIKAVWNETWNWDLLGERVTMVVEGIFAIFSVMAVNLGPLLVAGIEDAFVSVVTAVDIFVDNLWATLVQGIKDMFLDLDEIAQNQSAAQDALVGSGGGAITNTYKFEKKDLTAMETFAETFKRTFSEAFDIVKETFNNLKESYTGASDEVAGALERLDALVEEIQTSAESTTDAIDGITDAVDDLLTTPAFSQLSADMAELWEGTKQGALSALKDTSSIVRESLDEVQTAIADLLVFGIQELNSWDLQELSNLRDQEQKHKDIFNAVNAQVVALMIELGLLEDIDAIEAKRLKDAEDLLRIKTQAQDKINSLIMSDYQNELKALSDQRTEFIEAGLEKQQIADWYKDSVDAVVAARMIELGLLEEQTAEIAKQQAIEDKRKSLGKNLGIAERFAGTEMGAGFAPSIGVEGTDTKGMLLDLLFSFKAVDAVLNPLQTTINAVTGVFAAIGNVASNAIDWFASKIKDAIMSSDGMKEMMEYFSSTMIEIVDVAIKPLLDAIKPLVEFILQLVKGIMPALVSVFNMFGFLIKAIAPFLETFIKVVVKIVNVLVTALAPIFAAIVVILNGLTPVLDAVGFIFEALQEPLIKVATFFGKVAITIMWFVGLLVIAAAKITGMFGTRKERIAARELSWGPTLKELLDNYQKTIGDVAAYAPGAGEVPDPNNSDSDSTIINGGETTVQRAPEFHIYQYYQGPVIGAGGLAEVGEFVVRAISEHLNQGGTITWHENEEENTA